MDLLYSNNTILLNRAILKYWYPTIFDHKNINLLCYYTLKFLRHYHILCSLVLLTGSKEGVILPNTPSRDRFRIQIQPRGMCWCSPLSQQEIKRVCAVLQFSSAHWEDDAESTSPEAMLIMSTLTWVLKLARFANSQKVLCCLSS